MTKAYLTVGVPYLKQTLVLVEGWYSLVTINYPSFLKRKGFRMKVILFSIYYCKLQLSVLLGIHQTANPLSLNWRWKYWQSKYQRQHHRRLS